MIQQNFQIVWLDEGLFWGVAEEIVWVADNKLIERGGAGDHDGAGAAAAATGAAGALPGGSDGAGIAGHDDGIEGADVDAQFHGTGGDYAADAAVAEAAFDFAAFAGEVADRKSTRL